MTFTNEEIKVMNRTNGKTKPQGLSLAKIYLVF